MDKIDNNRVSELKDIQTGKPIVTTTEPNGGNAAYTPKIDVDLSTYLREEFTRRQTQKFAFTTE
jgi:hypothetical protein